MRIRYKKTELGSKFRIRINNTGCSGGTFPCGQAIGLGYVVLAWPSSESWSCHWWWMSQFYDFKGDRGRRGGTRCPSLHSLQAQAAEQTTRGYCAYRSDNHISVSANVTLHALFLLLIWPFLYLFYPFLLKIPFSFLSSLFLFHIFFMFSFSFWHFLSKITSACSPLPPT